MLLAILTEIIVFNGHWVFAFM